MEITIGVMSSHYRTRAVRYFIIEDFEDCTPDENSTHQQSITVLWN